MDSEGTRRVIVRIAPGNECSLGVNPEWSVIGTLAHLIAELSTACGHRFRGAWFPSCPGHDHAANTDTDEDAVVLRCPQDGHEIARLTPDLDPT
jgi:hypothetical protein